MWKHKTRLSPKRRTAHDLQTEDAAANLVAWAIDEKYLDEVASRALAESLPYSQDQLKEAMVRLELHPLFIWRLFGGGGGGELQ